MTTLTVGVLPTSDTTLEAELPKFLAEEQSRWGGTLARANIRLD
jgi:hypothetical protein